MQREVVSEESKEIEVPYTVLHSTDISIVAFAINVQLTLNDVNEQHLTQNSLPFVFPNDFDYVKDRDNLFIYGPSGCGKSRTIVEIFSRLSDAGGRNQDARHGPAGTSAIAAQTGDDCR